MHVSLFDDTRLDAKDSIRLNNAIITFLISLNIILYYFNH